MRDKPGKDPMPAPASFIDAQSAIAGLRDRDQLCTLRNIAAHGLRNLTHSVRHALRLGSQLGRALLGETLHPTNPKDRRFADPTWRLNPFYHRSLQAYLSWQQQGRSWIDETDMSTDDRARTYFAFALLNDAVSPSNTLLNPLAVKELCPAPGTTMPNTSKAVGGSDGWAGSRSAPGPNAKPDDRAMRTIRLWTPPGT